MAMLSFREATWSGVDPGKYLAGRPVMGHTPAITGVGKLLIKPSKEDRVGVARVQADRSRKGHP
jgi:hypothetical protein